MTCSIVFLVTMMLRVGVLLLATALVAAKSAACEGGACEAAKSAALLQQRREDDKADQSQPSCDETLSGTKGDGYRGCQSHTTSGAPCQKWTSQTPHSHSSTPANFPGKGLGDHDYCRNPDGEPTIWCYTMGTTRWGLCDPLPAPTTTDVPIIPIAINASEVDKVTVNVTVVK